MAGPFGQGTYVIENARTGAVIGAVTEGADNAGVSALALEWDVDQTPLGSGGDHWIIVGGRASRDLCDRDAAQEAPSARPMDRLEDASSVEGVAWLARGPQEALEIDPGFLIQLLGWSTSGWTRTLGYVYQGMATQNPLTRGVESWWIGNPALFASALAGNGVRLVSAGTWCRTMTAAKDVVAADGAFQSALKRRYQSLGNVTRRLK